MCISFKSLNNSPLVLQQTPGSKGLREHTSLLSLSPTPPNAMKQS